jgi:hypothetical protein
MLLVPILMVLALAGCGSDSSSDEEGTLTKAEFIAEADAICEASKARQETLRATVAQLAEKARGEEGKTGTVSDGTRKELADALNRVAAAAEAGFSRVQDLGSPQGDADQLETILGKTEAAFAASRAYAAALVNHEDAEAQAVAEKGNAETVEVTSLAKQYGFAICFSAPAGA